MKILNTTICLGLIGLGTALVAQEAAGSDYFFKIRAQAGLQSKDGLMNGMGIGAGYAFPLGPGKLSLELGYTYLPGKIFRGDIPTNSLGADQMNSVYTKKYQVDMLGIRGAYVGSINSDWSWNAGIGLYNAKARMETVATFWPGTGDIDGAWTTTREKSGITFIPFAGVTWRLSESGSLDFAITAYNFKLPDVNPAFHPTGGDYARVLPVWGDKSYSDVKLEIAYVFHF